jgi:hypothetical protein
VRASTCSWRGGSVGNCQHRVIQRRARPLTPRPTRARCSRGAAFFWRGRWLGRRRRELRPYAAQCPDTRRHSASSGTPHSLPLLVTAWLASSHARGSRGEALATSRWLRQSLNCSRNLCKRSGQNEAAYAALMCAERSHDTPTLHPLDRLDGCRLIPRITRAGAQARETLYKR